ncbi:MAG: DNA polymerase II [Candidatus Eisenbacteria bacterium]|nr:DNA polymerase II [Candidatus Latescibacterota bacterium]MBD3301304.1 DNA polymerase II [Candidatus Eisenbacteria bacterium]
MTRGFLLHPTYRIESGRPVVHLFGKLETGESFVARDRRTKPHFFIREADLERAGALGDPRTSFDRPGYRTMQGEPAARVSVPKPPDTPPVRDRFREAGIVCYEADVPFATRFLIDRGIRGALAIEGESRPGRLVDRVYQDADLAPADWEPDLRILSLDIETDARASRVFSIGLYGPDVAEVHYVPARDGPIPERAHAHEDEPALLRAFLRRLREIDPDVLVGWNVIDFDLSVLEARCQEHLVDFHLGRAEMRCTIRIDRTFWGSSRASIPGRVVLDGVALLRGAFVRLEDYRLETAARTVLGEGKIQASTGKGAWIEEVYRNDVERFVAYNLTDARLAFDVIERLRLIPLAIRRSLLTGMPLDRVGASIASFDFLYLHELRKRGIVAPSVEAEVETEPTTGGAVLPTRPGIYRNILVFDYRSLYPSLILTFHLDPLSFVPDPRPGEDLIRAPNGAHFRREGGILPDLLERFFPEREDAKRRGDGIGSTAYKILMNSFYGVLGTPRCRFHSPPTANAITRFGQTVLHWTKRWFEAEGYEVLYGDTDSLFVESGVESPDEARVLAEGLVERANEALREHFEREYHVESRLLLQFERLFERFFLPGLRHSREGSKKRYAGLVRTDGREEILFTGLESKRRDWTELAKKFQHELLWKVFHDEPVDETIRTFVEDLRGGRYDERLVYTKALRKEPEEYTATTPPHVKAARQMSERDGRLIAYVITTAGPEPAGETTHPLDYDHYIEKQIRPVAESVLACLGKRWEEVWSGQRGLFE